MSADTEMMGSARVAAWRKAADDVAKGLLEVDPIPRRRGNEVYVIQESTMAAVEDSINAWKRTVKA